MVRYGLDIDGERLQSLLQHVRFLQLNASSQVKAHHDMQVMLQNLSGAVLKNVSLVTIKHNQVRCNVNHMA